jgi:hypothetical protein
LLRIVGFSSRQQQLLNDHRHYFSIIRDHLIEKFGTERAFAEVAIKYFISAEQESHIENKLDWTDWRKLRPWLYCNVFKVNRRDPFPMAIAIALEQKVCLAMIEFLPFTSSARRS